MTAAKPVKVSAAPTPAPVNSSTPPRAEQKYSKRLTARADLLRVYAGLLGTDAVARDLVDGMTRAATDEGSVETLVTGLRAAGLVAEIRETPTLDATAWPALAEMTGGQVVLVLGQTDTSVTIYEAGAPDSRVDVPVSEFAPFFAGRLVRAEATLDDIARAHAPAPRKAHWFWAEFPRFKRYFGEVAIGSFVANLLAVAVALFSLQVYDRVIPHQSQATLWVLAAGAGLALLLEAGLKIARARLMDNVGRQIDLSLQQMLMERILGMRSDVAGRAPSQVFGTMREFSSIREFFTAATIGTIADIPFIFIFLLLVASIAGPVVWVLIAGGLLMVLPSFLMQRRMIRLTEEMQGASIKSGRLLQESIYDLDTVKTQRAEDRIRRVWTELTALSALKSSDQRKLASTLSFWSQGVQQATYVCAVIAGTFLVFAGEFTVGSIIAVGILTSRTLAPLTQLAGVMARWGNVKSALTALDQIVDAPQDADEGRTYLRRDAIQGAFDLREVRFAYGEDGATVVDVPGVQITAGQKVAVLGTNGSGKSTLLKMLSGLYAPTSGRILLDGTDLGQIEPRDVRRLVGYLGQDVRLFAGTLRDNLNLTLLERDDARLLQALDFAGLGPFVKAHPKGLDLEIGDGGQGLSVGQRQSIGWARLWLQDPKVCLLDEPTAALDQTLEKTLISRLEGWLQGRTAIVATHRMPIVELTSRTLVLQNGRMAVDGPREEVLAHLAGVKTGRAG
ncbi:ABC transporter ATP-binding protein [Pseudaestuariivita atlantica]|uniref:ABC transporter ATP-binding protein n=1 Tax=Pseudaestuariivita atlantica TaxID=1317121 RepID=A0A0L1JRP3_9RHOB|nr:ABC transporter ATP-binding protein [Pseudaestuariivita atlantica]